MKLLATVFAALCGAVAIADAALTTVNTTTSFSLTSEPVDAGFCDNTTQYSGYFHIDGSKSKNYFYWFFESRGDPVNDPVIIWLTGGPGCSSILALFAENGPCTIKDDLTLERNPYSWNERANIMWIDQPVGVGFSYGDKSEYDSTEKEVGDDMYHFLQSFFKEYPKYQKQPFHVFGESYAGHYVPAVAHRVFEGNNNKEGLHINLQGFGIGNGLTNPQEQYKYYPQMAYNNTYGVKAVEYIVYLAMKAAVKPCISMIEKCQTNKAACISAQGFCNTALVGPYSASGLNVYDVREECKYPPLCYDFSHVEKFLRLPSTLAKLHVNKHSARWESCNMDVHAKFSYDWMKSFHGLVTPMIESGIQALVYAGDADFIVNWYGCKAWTLELEWSKKTEFQQAPDNDWLVDGKKAGKIRNVGPFSFLQVFEAGHMVPLNQPKNSLAMLKEFTRVGGQQWTTTEQAQTVTTMEETAMEQTEELMAVM